MNIELNKKIARNFRNWETCKRRYGKEIATLMYDLIKQIGRASNFQQLRMLRGNFHRLAHLPVEHIYSVTLKQPYRCVMRVDIPSSTVTLEQIVDYHGKFEKLYRL